MQDSSTTPKKPDGYPHITTRGLTPVMVDWSPHGYEQTSDVRPAETSWLDAKRAAVEWSRQSGVPYKANIQ